jgi:hypothetical protein
VYDADYLIGNDSSYSGSYVYQSAAKTSAAYTGQLRAANLVTEIAAANDQNWNETPGGLAGIRIDAKANGSATGTLVGAIGVHIDLSSNGGMTWTNQYGIYIQAMDQATNNYAIFSLGGDVVFGGSSTVYIGDTANAEMTAGLTINQGAADDEILAFKSSDVSHGMTDTVETDTFGSIRKQVPGASGGGLRISGYCDTNTYKALVLEAFSADATPDTTDTSNSAGVMEFNAGVISGTDITYVPSGANAFVFGTSDRTDAATVMIIKGNGDVHQTTDAHTALDNWDDVDLLRAYSQVTAPDAIIRDEWDKFVDYNEQDLIAVGVLGAEGKNGLTNTSQLMRLHTGAIWQQNTKHMGLVEEVASLKNQLKALTEAK